MSNAPKGIGVYCRVLTEKTHDKPETFAKKLKDAGIAYAAFMACWQDKQGPGKSFRQFAGGSAATTQKYIDACHKVGIKAWLWGFPWIGHEVEYMDAMVAYAKALTAGSVTGFIHDPEVSYRDKNAKAAPAASKGQGEAGHDFKPEADGSRIELCARKLMVLDHAAVAELKLQPTGVTSYGMADWHALPWRIFADEGRTWGSPQLYTVTAAQVDQGLASWDKYKFGSLVPSVPGYGENSGPKLDEHLGKFVDGGDEPTIDGFIVWSYQQINGVEWTILKRWGDMLARRAC